MDTTQGESFFSNFPGMQSGPTLDDGVSAKFSEPSLRQNFIRKVLLIVTAQVIATAFIVGILISNERWLDNFSNSTSGWWILCLNTLIGFIAYLTLLCSKSIRRKVPLNYALLGLFTLCTAIDTAIICNMYRFDSILHALVMTAGVVGALTLYALNTTRDITIGNVFFYILIVDIGHLILWLFFGRYEFVTVLGTAIAAASFAIWLVHDIQTLMAGKRRSIDIDDYIFGAIIIYQDVVEIFIKILQLMGEKKDDDEDKKNKKK